MSIKSEIESLSHEINAGQSNIPEITIEKGALGLVPSYLTSNGIKKSVLVVDDNTYKVAGEQLAKLLNEVDIEPSIVILQPNKHGQVIADEQVLVQLLVETPNDADVLIAVGSGTIHDITRFVGYKMEMPFLSVPTAASVDGFTSKGAPLIVRGVKQTFQTASPVAVFADIDIIKAAPRELTAAGFGDILGKYTSLLDWKISDLIGDEPYNQLAADMTRRSLENCVDNVEKIAKADDEGIKILMQSLIESGLVMLVLDFSRPASGGEHHLSHYWEMDLLKKDAHQLLHGAKVGVTTMIITKLYKEWAELLDVDSLTGGAKHRDKLVAHWEEIASAIKELPTPEYLRELLKVVGGPTTPEDLEVTNELVEESLNHAYTLRDRCTGLLLINEMKDREIKYPFL